MLPEVSRLAHHPADAARLGDTLRSLGITASFVRRHALPGDDLRSPLAPTREAMLRADEPPFAAFLLLFCGQPAHSIEWFDHALIDSGVLVRNAAGEWITPFHLRVVDRLYLFSDYLGTDPEAVMGAGETTELLYQAAMPQQPIDTLLDWGCGAGTLALLMAGRATSVTGTDINERAITLARWNAAVNRITNVEFHCGDGFAPVAGRRFDLIVSQPPYYPLAENGGAHVFLHGGPKGDEIARMLIAALPAHLTNDPHARAILLSSWQNEANLPQPETLRLLELYTAVGDVPGTRQSLAVYLHGSHRDRMEVPADCWGRVYRNRIEQLLSAHQAARTEAPLPACERLQGVTRFFEGQQAYACFRSDALLPITPVNDDQWRCLSDPVSAPEPLLRQALANGWVATSSSLSIGSPRHGST